MALAVRVALLALTTAAALSPVLQPLSPLLPPFHHAEQHPPLHLPEEQPPLPSQLHLLTKDQSDVMRIAALQRRKSLLTSLLELQDLRLHVGSVSKETANARLASIAQRVQDLDDELQAVSTLELKAEEFLGTDPSTPPGGSAAGPAAGPAPGSMKSLWTRPVIDYGTQSASEVSGNAKLMATIIGTEPEAANTGPPPLQYVARADVLDPNFCAQQSQALAMMKAQATQSLQDAINALQAQLPGSSVPAVPPTPCASCQPPDNATVAQYANSASTATAPLNLALAPTSGPPTRVINTTAGNTTAGGSANETGTNEGGSNESEGSNEGGSLLQLRQRQRSKSLGKLRAWLINSLKQQFELFMKAGCAKDRDEAWADAIAGMPIVQDE